MAKDRIYLTAISVYKGIIQVIMPDGVVALFAQRGLKKLTNDEKVVAIERDLIIPSAFGLRELPSNISISFEDPNTQGKAVASFNVNILYK